MKGFIEVHTTYNYENKTLINISDIKEVYEQVETSTVIGLTSNVLATTKSIIEIQNGTLFRCLDTYEEIKKKIEKAQTGRDKRKLRRQKQKK